MQTSEADAEMLDKAYADFKEKVRRSWASPLEMLRHSQVSLIEVRVRLPEKTSEIP